MGAAAERVAVAADRFAREIVRILQASPSALAAAERQPVRRQQVRLVKICCTRFTVTRNYKT